MGIKKRLQRRWALLKCSVTATKPGANPIKLFTPLDKFTNPSKSMTTCFDQENI